MPAESISVKPTLLKRVAPADAPSEKVSKEGVGAAPMGEKKPQVVRPLDIAVPASIDRYAIGRRIGSGTCGVVHQALDNLLGRVVAIKLSPVGEANLSTGKVPGAQRAYQTEIIAAGALAHPNIVTVYDAGRFDELNYLVMEVVEGKSLKEYGKGKTPLPVHEALRVISDCCLALDHSHQQGILHRDIKPANIMLAENGQVKLLDFGIAVGLRDESELQRKGPTLGTPNYMSPEQILGRDLSPATDFYSLATVLFELLTGRQLFKARKVKDLFRAVVSQAAPQLQQVRPDLPMDLSKVLARALEKNPERRYQSGQEFSRALQPFVERFGVRAHRPPARRQLIQRLQHLDFFTAFSEAEISQLLSCVKLKRFAAGDCLTANAATPRRVLVLMSGLASARSDGRYRHLLAEGDCLGLFAFTGGDVAEGEVVALTEIKALEFSADVLSRLPPSTHRHFQRRVRERLRAESERAVDAVMCDYTLRP